MTDPKTTTRAGSDRARHPFRADGRDHGHERGIDRVVVQAPASVVLGQMRVSRMRREQVVESAGSGVDLAFVEAAEYLAQLLGECLEARDVASAQLLSRGRVDLQHASDGGEGIRM